jgi:membrane protein implicated in regulation of membrane protease activity
MTTPTMSSMQMGLTLIGWGLAVWVPASIVSYMINRRRFMRRNPAGIEEFESYGNFVVTHWLETGFMLLARLAKLGGGLYVVLGILNLLIGK